MKTDMRVAITKQLLKQGLLRMIARKPVSRINITELCEASGVNRATFYKHYDTPVMILREITYDYASQLKEIFDSTLREKHDIETGVETCLQYLLSRKEEIRLLLSENTENYISGFGLEIVNQFALRNRAALQDRIPGDETDLYLSMVLTSSAAFGLIRAWLVGDIRKTPKEIVGILKKTFGDQAFL